MLMRLYLPAIFLLVVLASHTFCQVKQSKLYHAGFTVKALKDSSRIYKPNTSINDSLHFRPVELDIWYPSNEESSKPLHYGALFNLFEERANRYQGDKRYTGIVDELAQQIIATLNKDQVDKDILLKRKTNSYSDLSPIQEKLPLIIYMAGFNGMGFENSMMLEELAMQGYLVVSVWSVGRYPGNMTNNKLDMMEQVHDATFALKYITENSPFNVDIDKVGVIGYSWGGMSAAVLLDQRPEIKAMVSLDGSETHYFGDSEADDKSLREIDEANLLNPEKSAAAYLYLESGNKFEEVEPTGQYNYFNNLRNNKYYTRFLESKHEDFLCWSALIDSTSTSSKIYKDIIASTQLFLDKHLKHKNGYDSYYQKLALREDVSNKPFEPDTALVKHAVQGTIVNAETGKPVPYVNVGILGQNLGTVSDRNGNFSIELNKQQLEDTLRFSCIGYQGRVMPLQQFGREKKIIKLKTEQNELQEVTIAAKGLKSRIIGNRTRSKFISTPFSYKQLGAEIGVKIPIRNKPTYVDSFNFYIPYNQLRGKALFRLNIYSIKDNNPHHNLLKENILVEVGPGQTGQIVLPLKQYDIILNDDVIVSLEWVAHDGKLQKGDRLSFSLGFFNHGTYVRYASQAEMDKKFGLGVGFNLNVRY